MKNEFITIPNVLSLSRLVFLPLLIAFVLLGYNFAFLIAFILIGSTDFFDGYIARKFNQTSEIGKRLDSFADTFFYVSCAWFLYRLYPEYLMPHETLLMIFFSLFFLSFIISSIKLKKPVLMHTFLFKLNAVGVYLLIILSYFTNTSNLVAFILIVYIIGFIEEIIIFIKYGDVDPDTLSIFHCKDLKHTIQ